MKLTNGWISVKEADWSESASDIPVFQKDSHLVGSFIYKYLKVEDLYRL